MYVNVYMRASVSHSSKTSSDLNRLNDFDHSTAGYNGAPKQLQNKFRPNDFELLIPQIVGKQKKDEQQIHLKEPRAQTIFQGCVCTRATWSKSGSAVWGATVKILSWCWFCLQTGAEQTDPDGITVWDFRSQTGHRANSQRERRQLL